MTTHSRLLKFWSLAAGLLALCALAATPARAADTYINATVGGAFAPGVYGQVQFGNAPPPPLLYAQPVVYARGPAYVAQPVYLYVPPGHAKNWGKHCGRYNACNRPVYFVRADNSNRWWDGRPGPRGGYDRHDDRGHGKHKDKHHKHDKHDR
jgi:hypothetical protein